jgi:DNA-directed RNA polymerase specialized sigma24 family protein
LNLKLNIAGLTNVTLLEQLCSNDDDNYLYDEFVKRFLTDLTTHCTHVCNKRNLEPHIGKQIAHETFSNVRKYKSFKTDGITLPDSREAILVYLKRISINLFNDFHNKQKREKIIHRTYFDDMLEGNESKLDAVGLRDKKEFALFIYNKLNKKEQTVVLADIEHKKYQKYLPDDITEDLALRLDVKKESIRKIRERAIEKIKKAINEFNENLR